MTVIAMSPKHLWVMVLGGMKYSYATPRVALIEISLNINSQWEATGVVQDQAVSSDYEKKFTLAFPDQAVEVQQELTTSKAMLAKMKLSLQQAEGDIQARDVKISELELHLKDTETAVSGWKQAVRSTEMEKQQLAEEVHILEMLSANKDVCIAEYETEIKLKEREGAEMTEKIVYLKQQLVDADKPSISKDSKVDERIKEKDFHIFKQARTIEAAKSLIKENDRKILHLEQELEAATRKACVKEEHSPKHGLSTQASSLSVMGASLDSSLRAATQNAYIQVNYLDYLALSGESLLAVEVLAETVFEITGDEHQSLTWKRHGFRLTVPAGAVPPRATISLAVKSILSGEFELPEKCELRSSIYWIKASQPFAKAVILHLHHCAVIKSEEQCSHYKFVAGRCSQADLPYLLKIKEGGVFTPRMREASISVKEFSCYGVVTDSPEDSETVYMSQAFFRPVQEIYAWQFDFLITHDNPSLVEEVQQEYKRENWTIHHEQYLEFEQCEDKSLMAITLRVSRPNCPRDKWELEPVNSLKINKRRVDRMRKKSKPPYCRLAIKWNGEPVPKLPNVSREVRLTGASKDDDSFSIQLPERVCSSSPPADIGAGHAAQGVPTADSADAASVSVLSGSHPNLVQAGADQSNATTSSALLPPDPVLSNVLDAGLDEDDLMDIVSELKDVTDVDGLGMSLGVRWSALEKIRIDCPLLERRKTQIIYHWLTRKDIVRKKQAETPTWTRLAEAVHTLNPTLSVKICNMHC